MNRMMEVISVEFFLHEAKLVIKTKRCADNNTKLVNIIFSDVYAYEFDEIGEENVIDEIAENDILSFLEWYYSGRNRNIKKQSAMKYHLPFLFTDKLSAIETLKTYTYYEINAYIGMDGFIIAKRMELDFPVAVFSRQ